MNNKTLQHTSVITTDATKSSILSTTAAAIPIINKIPATTDSLLHYLTSLARDFIKYISTSDIFSVISSKTNRISQDNEQIMTVGGIMILISVLLLLAEY
jgi:hypothetical protein